MDKIKIVYLNAHYDVCQNLYEWVKRLPLNIDYYICCESKLGGLYTSNPFNYNILYTLEELYNIIDNNTIIIGFTPDVCNSISGILNINKNFKIAIKPSGLYNPVNNFITHSKNYLNLYKNLNGLFIPKLYDLPFQSFNIRKNYYSYIRQYKERSPNSYLKFSMLHDILKQYGITLINYGANAYDPNGHFDVSQNIYSPRSKATVHIKDIDCTSNSVCKSIYFKTPVLMLEEDYNNCFHDSINGIVIFKNIEEMADYILKIENDDQFYNKLLEETDLYSKNNNILTDENISDSINWIYKTLNYYG